MIKYITIIKSHDIVLNLMGREKTFINNQEVHEDAYTKAYPQYFKKIGEIKGYSNYLAVPTFIPDPIEEFNEKESIRKECIKKEKKNIKIQEPHEVDLEEIAIDTPDVIFETEETDDVIFETEE